MHSRKRLELFVICVENGARWAKLVESLRKMKINCLAGWILSRLLIKCDLRNALFVASLESKLFTISWTWKYSYIFLYKKLLSWLYRKINLIGFFVEKWIFYDTRLFLVRIKFLIKSFNQLYIYYILSRNFKLSFELYYFVM